MIKFENTEVTGWEAAIRGMRNPLNSWEKSDSFEFSPDENGNPWIGLKDLNLMKRLRNAGTDHRKFMRMITVYVDITAPLYWWKEFDTYKVGTVANSCSTMHKIAAKEFTMEDFSCEYLLGKEELPNDEMPSFLESNHKEVKFCPLSILHDVVVTLNFYRDKYILTKDKKYWWQMIQLLPSSYNQKRTIMLNYEVLANIYKSRQNHKLDEWRDFCKWIKTLPYSELITGEIE